MIIRDMSKLDAMSLLSRAGFGRFACASGGQPYIVPLRFSVLGDDIFTFSTAGRKIEWMRSNPLVCVQADEIETAQKWRSVIVFGRYHEIESSAEGDAERRKIHDMLETQGTVWWEPGYARTILDGKTRPLDPVYFRISIDVITGHVASA